MFIYTPEEFETRVTELINTGVPESEARRRVWVDEKAEYQARVEWVKKKEEQQCRVK